MALSETATGPRALTARLEAAAGLDAAVELIEPTIRTAFGTGRRAEVLRGEWLGHALHPVLTDVVIGSWTSATVLDLLAGPDDSAAARKLVGVGLLAVGPTAWSGWSEWTTRGPEAKRVGLVHAVTNGIAIGAYAGSWVARRRGAHRTGVGLALVGASAMTVAGYLGGHLAHSREPSSTVG
jgi:predicted MFS family arabinose efflux permease